ncbi:MAG TPA: hypothetical protein VI837_11835 [Blastocatellia bacterium]|nr:hypothetical protein [Blastocatellia bacterium]
MKRILLILALLAFSSAQSFSMWAQIPLDQLVQCSDLIVVGTLDEVSQYSRDGMDYAEGTIRIDEVIWGVANAGESVTLKWQNQSTLVCPRVENEYNQSKKGIWLLTVQDGAVVRADYPGRFVDVSDRQKVERSLLKNKVSLRAARFFVAVDEPISVSLVFKNPTPSPIEFPGVEFSDGKLLLSPGVNLTLLSSDGEAGRKITSPLPGRVLLSQNLPPVLVGPQQEFRLTMNLRELFEIAHEEVYSVQLRVKGFGRANDIRIYPRTLSNPIISGTTGGGTIIRSRPPSPGFRLLIFSIVAGIGSSISIFAHRRSRRINPVR